MSLTMLKKFKLLFFFSVIIFSLQADSWTEKITKSCVSKANEKVLTVLAHSFFPLVGGSTVFIGFHVSNMYILSKITKDASRFNLYFSVIGLGVGYLFYEQANHTRDASLKRLAELHAKKNNTEF